MLPVDTVREELLEASRKGPVVLTAPTGTGKSTQVPRWLSGSVLMIQPRRVACRGVAERLSALEGRKLGQEIGYRVRDDDRSCSRTRILVATPGIVLTEPRQLTDFDTVIVDEVHERRLDVDLILALLLDLGRPFIAMSATIEGDRVANYARGRHVRVEGRAYPVEMNYEQVGDGAPTSREVTSRVVRALNALGEEAGDVLVFMPGVREIQAVCDALHGRRDIDARPLHGALDLEQQSRALQPTEGEQGRRRVVVTTNVAETSVTVPGIDTVIDSGLVRRTTYHEGRSYLALTAIAADSAEQRAGRAGRTAPGRCLRLWGSGTKLAATTPPEIEREPLTGLLLTIAKLGKQPEELKFLDAPKPYALSEARKRLEELGALSPEGKLTPVGAELERMPVDPWAARLLVTARQHGVVDEAVDLVSALEQRNLHRLLELVNDEDLLRADCDLTALLGAVRAAGAREARAEVDELLATRRRLRRILGLTRVPPCSPLDEARRHALIQSILDADPRAGHVARRRKSQIRFCNGGPELELSRRSRVHRYLENEGGRQLVEGLIVLGTRAVARGSREKTLTITAAAPVSRERLAEAGLGVDQLGRVRLQSGQVLVEVERRLAGQVLRHRTEEPNGELARLAIARLFIEGRLGRKVLEEATRRIRRHNLAYGLLATPEFEGFGTVPRPLPLPEWLKRRLEELGVETGSDLQLLEPEDLLPPEVDEALAPTLDERFPDTVDLGDCLYRVEYDLEKRQVLLNVVRGGRATVPKASYLPRFEGFKVFAEVEGSFHPVRR